MFSLILEPWSDIVIVANTNRELLQKTKEAIARHCAGDACGKTHICWKFDTNPRGIVAIWGGLGGFFGVDFSESRNERKYSEKNQSEAVADILDWLIGEEIQQGQDCEKIINQAIRVCEVVKINRTRCRLRYMMPNAGIMEGWHPVDKMFGKVILRLSEYEWSKNITNRYTFKTTEF